MKHISFPSIEQFRSVVRHVSKQAHWIASQNSAFCGQLPIVNFHGTVKIHGTNASIVYDKLNNVFYAQSRSNVLSLTQDNAGFCQYFETRRSQFEFLLKSISESIADDSRYVTVWGEWCGGNIQKGVAINGLDKMFVVFAVSSNKDKSAFKWHSNLVPVFNIPSISLYNIEMFETFDVTVDFGNPHIAQNKFVEYTMRVEEECPVGKFFGVSGIGEGIVWMAKGVDPTSPIQIDVDGLIFKTKGDKHSASKVKTIAAIDVEEYNKIDDLVNALATENRFQQGIEVLTQQGVDVSSPTNTRLFIEWVGNDVIKEEKDTILASSLDFSKVIGKISSKAGQWFNTARI